MSGRSTFFDGPFRHPVTPSDDRRASLSFRHGKEENRSGAFLREEEKSIRLTLSRSLGVSAVSASFFSEDGKELVSAPLSFVSFGRDFETERYECRLPDEVDRKGLYFVTFTVFAAVGRLVLSGNAYDAKAVTEGESPRFQISVSEQKTVLSEKPEILYHIFVDRFAKSSAHPTKKREDAILLSDENAEIPDFPAYPGAPVKNDFFYGGSLWGIAEKLDRLSELGVTILYLSPIFESASNHKYDTGDYERIDAMFGGEEALRHLIAEAKKRSMRVVLDGVFNHTGADSRYFNRFGRYGCGGAYQDRNSPYTSWYEFKRYPDRYVCWWDVEILPRIRTGCRSFEEYIAGEGGVIGKYAKMGVGGFRLDVADELSDAFLTRISSALHGIDPTALLFGEVWEDASNKIAYGERKTYYLGGELDGVMNYPLRKGLIDWLRFGNVDSLRYALTEVAANAPKPIRDRQMNLIGTHDTERILTALGGELPGGYTNAELREKRMTDAERSLAKRRLLCAYTALATLPGIPSIYYGDEAGMEGYSDPFNRRFYPWGKEDGEILETYRTVGEIRNTHDCYLDGGYRLLVLSEDLLLFTREQGGRVCLTAVNRSEKPIFLRFSKKVKNLVEKTLAKRIALSPISSAILQMSDNAEIEIEKQ